MHVVGRTLGLGKTLVHKVLSISYPGWGEFKGLSKFVCFRAEKGNSYDKTPYFLLHIPYTHSHPTYLPAFNLGKLESAKKCYNKLYSLHELTIPSISSSVIVDVSIIWEGLVSK